MFALGLGDGAIQMDFSVKFLKQKLFRTSTGWQKLGQTERQALCDLRQYKFVLCGVAGVRNILLGQNSTFADRDKTTTILN